MTQILKRFAIVFALTLGLFTVAAPVPAFAATNPNCATSAADAETKDPDQARKCIYDRYINPTIRVMTYIVGIVVVAGITMGAIQYASSAGDPQKASAGKGKILKAMYGLLAFFFLYSALQFLVPGGLSAKTYSNPNAATCARGNDFLTLKPWYAYLPATSGSGKPTFDKNCQVQNFDLLPNDQTNGKTMIPSVLLVIVDDLMRIIGLIAVAYVIIGGIQYVTSQGEPDRTKRAQETILNALIGLVVAIIAASFVAYVGGRIV